MSVTTNKEKLGMLAAGGVAAALCSVAAVKEMLAATEAENYYSDTIQEIESIAANLKAVTHALALKIEGLENDE